MRATDRPRCVVLKFETKIIPTRRPTGDRFHPSATAESNKKKPLFYLLASRYRNFWQTVPAAGRQCTFSLTSTYICLTFLILTRILCVYFLILARILCVYIIIHTLTLVLINYSKFYNLQPISFVKKAFVRKKNDHFGIFFRRFNLAEKCPKRSFKKFPITAFFVAKIRWV